LFLLSSHIVCFSFQENDAIYNGFKQFLGDIYSYASEPLSGGINHNTHLYMVNNDKYVVRVIKKPLPTRLSEVSINLFAAHQSIAPKIYYYEHHKDFSFMIMDFIDAHTLSFEQACRCDVLSLMAEKIKLIQQFDAAIVVHKGENYFFAKIRESFHAIKHTNILDDLPILKELFDKAEMINEIIESWQRPIVVSHNDLNPRNVFFINNNIIIIDWEISGMNDAFYDLASYSMLSCLSEEDDYYLLTHYLNRAPLLEDIQHFKDVKLLARAYDVFMVFVDHFLNCTPESIVMEAVKDFGYYERIFAEDLHANSAEFFYAMALGQIREFFKEYKRFEEDYLR
jgi:thiamine kinase-like enzyme